MQDYPYIFISLMIGLIAVSGFILVDRNIQEEQEWSETIKPNAINAVIGDESYRATYGKLPDESISEKKRIITHLEYVKQKLSQKNVDHLTEVQKQNRQNNLERLQDYIREQEFPVNNAFQNVHRPNFIDSEGRICAVGYLVEQSMGRDVAEKINEEYQYEYVLKMDSKLIENWAHKNGFTTKELAMIQPAYCFDDCANPGNKISKTTEAIAIGANAGMSLVNGYLATNNSSNIITATAGVALGAATVTLGLTDHANYSTTDYITGGISVAAGSWALYSLINKKPSENDVTVTPVADTRFDGNVCLSVNYRF